MDADVNTNADIAGSKVALATETLRGTVRLATSTDTAAGLAVQANDSRLGGGGMSETDPQVDDNTMTLNTVPRWNDTTKKLVGGSIYDNGNVGIGTAIPGSKLMVAGDVQIYADDADGRLFFHDPGNFIYSLGMDYSDGRKFKINRWGLGDNNDFTIDTSGNVGIGITPHYLAKLDVNGHAAIRGVLAVGFDPPTPLEGWPVDRKLAVNGHTYLFGDVYVHWVKVASDDRIKLNEQKLEYGLAQIMALEPKRYDRAEYEYDPETEELVIHPERTNTNDLTKLT